MAAAPDDPTDPPPDLRENFIPLSKRDVVELCATDPRLDDDQREAFREFCQLVAAVFHFEFHDHLEQLKACHAPFDPDADTQPVEDLTAQQLDDRRAGLRDGLERLLRSANYDRVQQATLEASLVGESLFKVRLEVDFDDFDELLLFRRGRHQRSETVRTLYGLRKQEVSFLNFSRVVLMVRFKPAAYFEALGRKALPFVPGSTVLKLFRDVPAEDLEMVFPNTAVRMKLIDKLLIGVPAFVGGIVVVATKLAGTLLLVASLIMVWLGLSEEDVEIDDAKLVALGVGLGTLGAFIVRQVNRFKQRKISFLKALTENLYFKNLDNNAGVLHRLIDDAEEEECKEAILAYWFLLTSGSPHTAEALDRGIEDWLRERAGRDTDFEIQDATQKLERLGLVARDRATDELSAVPLGEAKHVLDRLWDGYFDYSPPSGSKPG